MAHLNVAHIVNAHNGHFPSVTCWCEPTSIYWITNIYNVKVLVVWHEDLVHPPTIPHSLVLDARDDDPDDWITQVLNTIEPKGESHGFPV